SDAFDAMMSKRSYRDELGIDKAVSELRRCSGTQFDPQVVDAFVRLIEEEWDKISEDVGEINRKLGK
ncbi:MAG TPA: HD-GYP domain-containing protein, partial [Clostridiales bacterium]|nr:HD-GYP domain-containing protein [Clostridiales bacterium]